MFEKITKRFSNKATEGAIEGVKKSFNDRLDQYGDIIEIGLVLMVIIFGGSHLTKKSTSHHASPMIDHPSYRLPSGNGQPIIINNYYQRANEEVQTYHGNQRHYGKTKTGKTDQRH